MEKEELFSRSIFIDTQAYYKHGFNFSHGAIKRIKELSSVSSLELVLTDVVAKEVSNKIFDKVKESDLALSKFLRKSEVLKGKKGSD